ncbi:hypothetical protein GW17_00007880 [Ensete ventricosum]|nr:hypothetical protein GW17_00007880 [Ensete ventricosum]
MEEEMFLKGAMGAGSMERAFSRVRAPRKERAREMWRVVSDARTVAGVEMYRPRGRLQRPQAIRNWAVVSNVRKSLKLRRWTILGGISNVAALCRSRCWNPWLRRMPSRESAAAEATARLATESSVMLVVRRMGGCSPLPRSIPTSPLSRFPSAIPFLPRGAETGERKAFARLKRATEAEMGCFVALYRMVVRLGETMNLDRRLEDLPPSSNPFSFLFL